MPVLFPVTCDSPRKRMEFCISHKAKLRNLYNFMGRWKRGELTQAQYDKLPLQIRTNFSFVTYPTLPNDKFGEFKNNYFYPKEKKIIGKLNINKDLLEVSTTWSQDLDEI